MPRRQRDASDAAGALNSKLPFAIPADEDIFKLQVGLWNTARSEC